MGGEVAPPALEIHQASRPRHRLGLPFLGVEPTDQLRLNPEPRGAVSANSVGTAS